MKAIAVALLLSFPAYAAEVVPCRTSAGGTICVGMVKEQAPVDVPTMPTMDPAATQWLHIDSAVASFNKIQALLPKGRYKTEAGFAQLDKEVRRLQTVEVSLTAENTSLREAIQKPPSLAGLAVAAGLGIVLGGIATGYLFLKK